LEGKEDKDDKDLNESGNDIPLDNLEHRAEAAGLSEDEGAKETVTKEKPVRNKGKLIVDATVADQMIAYPTDLGLLSRSREESERLIDELCKNRNKSNKEIRKAVGQQLRYLRRNLKSIIKILDTAPSMSFPLEHRDQRIYWVIQHIYEQQSQMYKEHTHSVDNRIVNIYQPHVRPIVRGKDKAQVEFGAKLGISLQDGYARINTLSWEAYNEGGDLKKQVEAYKRLNGIYPEVVIADKIYGTRENRYWLKKLGIRYSGRPLGRPSVKNQTPYSKRKQKVEQGIRNQVEGKFGQGENGYNLNKIRARAAKTSESWIAAIFFVMNLVRFSKEFLYSFMKELFASFFSMSYRLNWHGKYRIAYKIQ
jgi:hypothetical protein